ncbi:hypothetical protein BDQ17DRAFT_1331897 [Cyathus striatus]|nr:hypothetical protein BDQ17DRAFT_1331897 [Cyathus striatus]
MKLTSYHAPSHLLQPWQKTLAARLFTALQARRIHDITEGTFGKIAVKYISKAVIRREKRKFEYIRTTKYHQHQHTVFILEYTGGELFNRIVANGPYPNPAPPLLPTNHQHNQALPQLQDLKPEGDLLDDDLNVKMAYVGLSNEISDGDFLTSIIEGLGRIEEDVVDELARRLKGVEKDEAWEALRRDDRTQGDTIRNERRLGKDLSIFAEKERDAELAAMDYLAYATIAPKRSIPRPIQRLPLFLPLFLTILTHPRRPPLPTENPNFAILNTSLPAKDANGKEEHHLASFVSARKAGLGKEKGQHKIKRHFGFRSRNPPIEVMFGDLQDSKSPRHGVEGEAGSRSSGRCPAHVTVLSFQLNSDVDTRRCFTLILDIAPLELQPLTFSSLHPQPEPRAQCSTAYHQSILYSTADYMGTSVRAYKYHRADNHLLENGSFKYLH